MAKLGDAFSEPERKKSVLRRLVPGAVLYLEVASVEAECCTFVVNSTLSTAEQTRLVESLRREGD